MDTIIDVTPPPFKVPRLDAYVEAAGWTALLVWECETRSAAALDSIFWRVVAASPAPR